MPNKRMNFAPLGRPTRNDKAVCSRVMHGVRFQNMDGDLFLSEQHPMSLRWVVLEDDRKAAWLYLTNPDTTVPVAACWLYNCVEDPGSRPDAEQVSFHWSADG